MTVTNGGQMKERRLKVEVSEKVAMQSEATCSNCSFVSSERVMFSPISKQQHCLRYHGLFSPLLAGFELRSQMASSLKFDPDNSPENAPTFLPLTTRP
jgi:hypothetical protein